MNKKKIEPTDAMVDWAANILCLDATHTSLRFHAGLAQQAYRNRARAVMRTALCLALNHPDAAGLFECDHTDYVHVDEAARRVEAAREQAWNDAADWVKRREAWTDEELRAANPHRPAPALPTEDGAVIVPADGCEFILVTDAGGWAFERMTYSAEHDRWYGMTKRGAIAMCIAEQIIPGTWKVDDK